MPSFASSSGFASCRDAEGTLAPEARFVERRTAVPSVDCVLEPPRRDAGLGHGRNDDPAPGLSRIVSRFVFDGRSASRAMISALHSPTRADRADDGQEPLDVGLRDAHVMARQTFGANRHLVSAATIPSWSSSD